MNVIKAVYSDNELKATSLAQEWTQDPHLQTFDLTQ
jgi:hypothetical protein